MGNRICSSVNDVVSMTDFGKYKVNSPFDGCISSEFCVTGEVNGEMVKRFWEAFSEIQDSLYFPFLTHININFTSPGGTVSDCFTILDAVQRFKDETGKKVSFVGSGDICSAGVFIFASGDDRFCYKNTTFLYHEVGHWYNGKLSEIFNNAKRLKDLQDKMDKYLIKRTKFTQEDLTEMSKIDYFFNANKAKKMGLVHKIWS